MTSVEKAKKFGRNKQHSDLRRSQTNSSNDLYISPSSSLEGQNQIIQDIVGITMSAVKDHHDAGRMSADMERARGGKM